MKAYQADIAKFEANDTQVFGLSVDSPFANAEFAKQNGVTFPILSDFAKRSVVKAYGIYNEDGGYGNRATFVIDKNGIVQKEFVQAEALDPNKSLEACALLKEVK